MTLEEDNYKPYIGYKPSSSNQARIELMGRLFRYSARIECEWVGYSGILRILLIRFVPLKNEVKSI